MKKKTKIIVGIISFMFFIIFNFIAYNLSDPTFNKVVFGITGIIADIAIYKLILYAAKCCKVELKKRDMILLVIFLALSLSIYSFIIYTSKKIYVWDNAVYYKNMSELLGIIKNDLFSSYYQIIRTSIIDDYGKFLLVFIYPFYAIAPGSAQWLNLCYFFAGTIPSIILLYIFGLYIMNKLKVDSEKIIYKIFMLFTIIIFPMLHESTILGRPDIIGLVFVMLIILMTVEYKFDNKAITRWIVLFLVTLMLILTRRWYLYFVVAYYMCYTIMLLISTIKTKDKKIILHRITNLAIFGVSSLAIMLIILIDLVKKVFKNDYSKLYSPWNRGGLLYEPVNQVVIMGLLIAVLILIGFIYCLINKKTRYNSLMLFSTYIVSIILFTRVQNFESHQSLILMPFYILCLYGIIYLSLSSKKVINYILRVIVILFPTITMVLAIYIERKVNTVEILNPIEVIYGNSKLHPVVREDIKQIKKVIDYIDERRGPDDKVVIYAAGNDYDSQYFVNYPTPNANKKYIYSNNFLYAEGFPSSVLRSKYYVMLEPLQEWKSVKDVKLLYYLTDIFYNDEYISKKFIKLKEIDLDKYVKAVIYERIQPEDDKEIDIYIELCEREYSDYNDLFYKRLVEEKERLAKNNKKIKK